jgi:hypothetical protein
MMATMLSTPCQAQWFREARSRLICSAHPSTLMTGKRILRKKARLGVGRSVT